MFNILKGLLTVFKHLFLRPVTLEYPEKKRFQSDDFRGKPKVNLEGKNSCVGCGVCQKVCPSNAIKFFKDENGKVVSYTFDLEKCIFCGNCMYYCPHKAVNMTNDFELATEDKRELKLNYRGGVND